MQNKERNHEVTIRQIIKTQFAWSDEKFEAWWTKPHTLLDSTSAWWTKSKSPKELVQSGEGEKVIDFLQDMLGCG